jgi:predicted dehydrogenase
MSDHGTVRFGMVGTGAIAQAYAQSFGESEVAELVAVCDVRVEAADATAKASGAQPFSSYQAMCDKVSLDAVVVCTPPVSHPDICVDLAQKGIHILCEKPLAIDSASARRMIDAAERAEVTLTMASKFRYVDDVIQAKSLVESGVLGDIVLFENSFTAHVDMTSRWNSDPAVSGGGVLIDNGTHSVDIIRYFFGPLADLQVIEGKRVQDMPVEDTVRVFARTLSGVMGSADLSWSINKEQPTYINIYGSHGTAHLGWKESKYRRTSDEDWIVFGQGYNKFQAFRSQIDNFSNALRGKEPLLITAEDGLASVQAIEAAYSALRNSPWRPIAADTASDLA